jgi:hypothetical protein
MAHQPGNTTEAGRLRHKGKGSGSYLGGHTVIGPHTPGWFGWKKD